MKILRNKLLTSWGALILAAAGNYFMPKNHGGVEALLTKNIFTQPILIATIALLIYAFWRIYIKKDTGADNSSFWKSTALQKTVFWLNILALIAKAT